MWSTYSCPNYSGAAFTRPTTSLVRCGRNCSAAKPIYPVIIRVRNFAISRRFIGERPKPQSRNCLSRYSQFAMTKPLLALHDVSLSFKGVKALTNLSFTVQAGQVCALIGPNGAG